MINIKQVLGLETLIKSIPTGEGFIQTGVGPITISGDLYIDGQLTTSGNIFSSGQIFLVDTRPESARIEINSNNLRVEDGIYLKASNTGTEPVLAKVSDAIFFGRDSYISGNDIYSKSGVSIRLGGIERLKIDQEKTRTSGALQSNNIIFESLEDFSLINGQKALLDSFSPMKIDFKKYRMFVQGMDRSAGIDATVSAVGDSAYLRYSSGAISGLTFLAERAGDSISFEVDNSSGDRVYIKWYSEAYLKILGAGSSESSHSSESSGSSSVSSFSSISSSSSSSRSSSSVSSSSSGSGS